MASIIPDMPGAADKLQSAWSRPSGKLAIIVGLAAFGAIGLWVLPILTAIVWSTLNFGIALGCLGAFCG